MKNPFKKKTTSLDIRAELARLTANQADHRRRHASGMDALEQARIARREVLDQDQAEIDKATAEVRRLKSEIDEMAGTISDFEDAIKNTEGRLREATDQEIRRAEADRREAAAAKVEALVPDLQKAVAALAKAAKAMIAAVPHDVGLFPAFYMNRPGGRPEAGNDLASAREAVASVVAEALLSAAPELFDTYSDEIGYRAQLSRLMAPTTAQPTFIALEADFKALSTEGAVGALITGRLRERAAEILAGEVEPRKSTVAIVTPYRRPDTPAEVEIVGLTNFRFLDGEPGFKPRSRAVGEGEQVRVHEAVARHAIACAAAAPAGSDAADDLLEALRNKRSARAGAGPTIDEHTDIGDPLGLEKAWRESKLEFANVEREEVARALG